MAHPDHDHPQPHWLRTKLSAWFWSLTPACKEVARLTSEGRDRSLPLGMRLRLRLHRAFCQWCARYAKQLDLVHEATHLFPEHTDQVDTPPLDSAAKARMKRAVRDEVDKTLVATSGLFLGLIV
jgi:hypothetical protein